MTLNHRCKNTSWEEKVCFALLWRRGFTVRAISKVARRSPTTVRKWVRHLEEASLTRHPAAAIPVPPHNWDSLFSANLPSAIPYPNLRCFMCGCQYNEGKSIWKGMVPALPLPRLTGNAPDTNMKQQVPDHSGVSVLSSLPEYPGASYSVHYNGKSHTESSVTSDISQTKVIISRDFHCR